MNQHDEKHYKFGRTDPWPDYPLEDVNDDKGAIDAYIVIASIVIALWLLFGSPNAEADEVSQARQELIETLGNIQREDNQRKRDFREWQFRQETTQGLQRIEREAEFRGMVNRGQQFLLNHEIRQK